MNESTDARNARILELRALGWTQQAIADEVGCGPTTVRRILDPAQAERMRECVRAWGRAQTARRREQRRQFQQENAEQVLEKHRAKVARKAAYDREYNRANAERQQEYSAAYRKANAEKIRERQRRYREANREQILRRKRERWAADAEALNAERRSRYDDEARERLRAYRLANIEASRAIVARRKMRAGKGMDATDRLLSVEYRKAISKDTCAYCPADGEHDDHMLPLARGGTDHWWNLQRTCMSCNQHKHTKTHEEFLASARSRAA